MESLKSMPAFGNREWQKLVDIASLPMTCIGKPKSIQTDSEMIFTLLTTIRCFNRGI